MAQILPRVFSLPLFTLFLSRRQYFVYSSIYTVRRTSSMRSLHQANSPSNVPSERQHHGIPRFRDSVLSLEHSQPEAGYGLVTYYLCSTNEGSTCIPGVVSKFALQPWPTCIKVT